MRFLKNKWTRLAVLLVASVLVCGCTLKCLDIVREYDDGEAVESLYNSDMYSLEGERLYSELWLFANLYIKNQDENGMLDESSFKTKHILNALESLGYKNGDFLGSFRYSDIFNFYVEYKGVAGYSDSDVMDFPVDEYTILIRGNEITSYPSYFNGFGTGCHYYTNGKGFEYYYIPHYNKGFAVYDYDTEGLQSYVDELGATIYLNEDGSSPIPTAYRQDAMFTTASDYVPCFEGDDSLCEIRLRLNEKNISAVRAHEAFRHEREKKIVTEAVGFIPVLLVILVLSVYVMLTAGFDSKENKYKMTGFDRIFIEVCVLVLVLSGMCLVMLTEYLRNVSEIDSWFSSYGYEGLATDILYGTGVTGVYIVVVLILSSFVLRLRCKSFFKTSLIFIILSKIFSAMGRFIKKAKAQARENEINAQILKDNNYLRRFIIRTAVFFAVGLGVLFIGFALEGLAFLVIGFIILVCGFVYLCIKDLRELTTLSEHIRRISEGDYTEYALIENSSAYGMHYNLNEISGGFRKSVEEQLKSERMKIDLVTNVSHDLKTPLTSIISYIDLLSKEELSPEARDYVAVLENKSAKLKSMVSDVFDLAKATSRTDIKKEKLDMVILTGQVLADLNDKITNSGMEIRKNINADTAPVNADGKKLYRVMQNLIDNALKYSLSGTRIYISLENTESETSVKIQNIASYEMNFKEDEITERFTRGDEARTTEGNGLGLSIAKSYTEACGGCFRVEINGDSFTAVVTLPLSEEKGETLCTETE